MRYVNARLEDFEREEAYRIYVTKSLQLIPQQGHIENSYYDIMHNNNISEEDNRSGEEIVVDIMTQAGLRFKDGV